MKILQIQRARSVWLFQLNKNRRPVPDLRLVEALRSRYQFLKFPNSYEEISSNPVVFKGGEFNKIAIRELSIYHDGIIVDTSADTDLADALLDDLVSWSTAEFGIELSTYPELTKLYGSEIVFQTDTDFDEWLAPIRQLGKIVTDSVSKYYEKHGDYSLSGVHLDFDRSQMKGSLPTEFRLERKVDEPYEPGIYYSLAPLPTSEHIQVLETLIAQAR